MFSKTITNSSQFLMMPQSSQGLYFHLGMNADDDGFVEHFTIMRMTESKPDDLKILQAKGFVSIFDDRVLVVLDWKEHNYLRSDRYKPSKYLEIYRQELAQIGREKDNHNLGIPNVNQMDTQVRLELGKDRVKLGEEKESTPSQIATEFFKAGPVYGEMVEVFSKDRDRAFTEKEFGKFSLYWTEPNKSGTKVRWQQEGTFEIKRRLLTWMNRAISYSGGSKRGTGAGIAI